MKVLVLGASGYIGGSVAVRLVEEGFSVTGLIRDETKGAQLKELGIEPLIGDLDDADLLKGEAQKADAIICAANADHRESVESILEAVKGTNKVIIHTSGSSLIGDDARGLKLSEKIYDEYTPMEIHEGKKARYAIDLMVLDAAKRGVRSAVICPSLVYGTSRGLNKRSIQVPFLVDQAKKNGVVKVVGSGVNRWSTVHITDLEELYLLALQSAPAGAFYFAENGESSYLEIGEAIALRLGLSGVSSWNADEAAEKWGQARAFFTFGSNSRVRSKRAKTQLNWSPKHDSVVKWILEDMPINDEEGK
ncbi:NAD-dependent epimerase/dehydratase family protein [Pseudarthrobacter sulfonivorans]|uniref:NAD-dependent epimerase/dehydratase family protein n=1 Tax=Pseudarthrobacter sulfonivorans TaxID=121292 RepID=UPI0027D8CD75|nr:NAD-dependent epimerase/dehydratase family protein [Pseudarthrobacter sulfonivorans]